MEAGSNSNRTNGQGGAILDPGSKERERLSYISLSTMADVHIIAVQTPLF